jgi:hypothetical protein
MVKFCAVFLAVSAVVGELFVAFIMLAKIKWITMCLIFMGLCASYAMFPIMLSETPCFFYSYGKPKAAAKVLLQTLLLLELQSSMELKLKIH